MPNHSIQIIPVPFSPDVARGDDIGRLIVQAIMDNQVSMMEHDIVVVTQKIVSKSEGRIRSLSMIEPSKSALELAHKAKKDPRFVELILLESNRIVRCSENVIISETKHGFVCANAGIDQSNLSSPENDKVLLLPVDPDLSARKIKHTIEQALGRHIAVIITDTFGRPFRVGQTNVAIGTCGINSIKSYIGRRDMYGNILRVTEIAVADEIASAAELVMGKINRVPVVIVRGYEFSSTLVGNARSLVRESGLDLFR
jgi:coenzyme F420-0:L-glutamate ligase / coenzyme F420-1:gamma-L-glutamate ligase